jgi:hypothetical protein
MWAALIILTSFAPSPIASVSLLGYLCFIIFTISAFYLGDTLHAKTTSTLSLVAKNMFLIFGCLSIIEREAPATIIAYSYFP